VNCRSLFVENSLWKRLCNRVIAGFRRGVNEILTFVVCYAASIGSYLATFRDNLMVPY
jgi:hypothetical protein